MRGRVSGGSSAVNGMIYNRGSAADYDALVELAIPAGAGTRYCPSSAASRTTNSAPTSYPRRRRAAGRIRRTEATKSATSSSRPRSSRACRSPTTPTATDDERIGSAPVHHQGWPPDQLGVGVPTSHPQPSEPDDRHRHHRDPNTVRRRQGRRRRTPRQMARPRSTPTRNDPVPRRHRHTPTAATIGHRRPVGVARPASRYGVDSPNVGRACGNTAALRSSSGSSGTSATTATWPPRRQQARTGWDIC